jgi:hypothetical protein
MPNDVDAGLTSTVPVVAKYGLVPLAQSNLSTAMLMLDELVGTRLAAFEPQ